MAAFQESPYRVNVEFLRASQPGIGRVIRFNHRPDAVPPQLQGRVQPQAWASFMADVDTLARHHPYVQHPSARHYGKWAACFAVGAVVGLFCASPDAGDYGQWLQEAAAVVERHQPPFNAAGCLLSLQGRRDHWLQVDVNPAALEIVPAAKTMVPSPFASNSGK